MTDLEIVAATRDHAIGRWRAGMLYVWRGPVTVLAANTAARTVERVRANVPEGPGVLLGVVEEQAPPPSAEVRKALGEVLVAAQGFALASALVCEGRGFRASMTRAVATGITMFSRPAFAHQVFAEVLDATDWIERRLRVRGIEPFTASELDAAMRALRAAPHRA